MADFVLWVGLVARTATWTAAGEPLHVTFCEEAWQNLAGGEWKCEDSLNIQFITQLLFKALPNRLIFSQKVPFRKV